MRRVFLIVLGCVLGSAAGSTVRHFFRSEKPQPVAAVASVEHPARGADPAPAATAPAAVNGKQPEPLHPTGWAMTGRKISVMMSDGTVRVADRRWSAGLSDPIEQASPSHVLLDGERLFIRPRPRVEGVGTVSAVLQPATATEAPAVVQPTDDGKTPWYLDADGVYRLRDRSSFRNTYSPTR